MEINVKMQPDLLANITNGDISLITLSASYKIHLKRYVDRTTIDTIYFRSSISYISVKKILDVLQNYSVSHGYHLIVEPNVIEHISNREMYLDTRSKLGVEIKNKELKLLPEYNTFRGIVNSSMVRKLRDQQMWDSFFMTSMKKSCNFSVPGSGKTSSVYGMFAFLKQQGIINRIVVICPKNAFAPWVDEFAACFGKKENLNLFNIQEVDAKTRLQKKAFIKFDTGNNNLLLFNYESIKSYAEEIKTLIDKQTLLVFDEVHKVKRINGEYATAAINIAKGANYTVAMTGTPIPNTYQDIYNLLHILYSEEYDDFFSFQVSGLKNPTMSTMENVNRKLQPFFCRTTKNQLGVPQPNSDSIIPVQANDNEQRLFYMLSQKYKKNKLLLMLRILQLESQADQLLSSINLADFQYLLTDDVPIEEIDYADYSQEFLDCINSCSISTKTSQCINLIKGLTVQGKPVVVWCMFVKTINNLADILENEGIRVKCIYGEVELSNRQKILRDFKNHKFDVLITNPNTLAESISLHTVCHDAIYFEYSFNLVHLLQSKDRIHRLGLPEGQYTQFYYLQTMYPKNGDYYSMGKQIYERLLTKEKTMLNAIESDLLEVMPTTQEELDLIFSPILGNR